MRAGARDGQGAAAFAAGLSTALGPERRPGPAPVHLWAPPFCGDIDMRIAADGTWFYQGSPIGRPALVALFASVLKREGEKFFLVTPVEKVGIRVDDAPFVAVDARREGEALVFRTNLGEEVAAGPDRPIRVAGPLEAPRPYVRVRDGLEALIDRKTFYRLVEEAETRSIEGADWLGVASRGAFFPLAPAAALAP